MTREASNMTSIKGTNSFCIFKFRAVISFLSRVAYSGNYTLKPDT